MTQFRLPKIIYSLVIFSLLSCSVGSNKEATEEKNISNDDSKKTEQPEEGEKKAEIDDSNEEEKEDLTELELLAEAIRSYDAGRYMISKNFWEKIIQNYPGSPLSLTAELKMADCLFYAERYVEAIAIYREFAKVHSKHEARAYSLFQVAEAFKNTYQGTKQDLTPLKEAIKQYVSLINEYPGTSYATQASSQIVVVEEELFKSELSVIEFYTRTGNEKSAASRKAELKKLFGHLDAYKKMFANDAEEEQLVSSEKKKEEIATDLEKTEVAEVEEIGRAEEVVSPSPTSSPSFVASAAPSSEIKKEEIQPSEKEPLKEVVLADASTPTPKETVQLKLGSSFSPSPKMEISQSVIVPSATPEILASVEEPLIQKTEVPTVQVSPSRRPENLKTLADLEQVEEVIIARMASPKASVETYPESSPIANAAAENKLFLQSARCEQEDGITKIFIKFNSRPFLKSSTKDGEGKTRTVIIFQEGFSTDAIPADGNEDEWIKRPSKVCSEYGQESVVIQERIRTPSQSNQFGPKSYLFVYVNSERMSKISIVNGSSPESLAIVAQNLD